MNLQQNSIKNAYQSAEDKTDTKKVLINVATALNIDQKVLSFYVNKCQLPLHLSNPTTQQQIITLFDHFRQNQSDIEKQFNEEQSSESPLIQLIPLSQDNTNYKQNRKNIGRFIRDQHQHYESCLKSHLESTEDDRIILVKNMHSFLKDLFTFKNFQLNLQNGRSQHFFKSDSSHDTVMTAIKKYFSLVKSADVDGQSSYIAEEEILDFIECWIRTDIDIVSTYIYENRNILINAFQEPETNHIDKPEVKTEEKNNMTDISNKKQPRGNVVQQTIIQTIKKYESMLATNPPETQRTIILNTLRNLEQQLKKLHSKSQEITVGREQVEDIPQDYQLQLFKAFREGCWKNYNLAKHTTFNDIYQNTMTMDEKKFKKFCSNFELTANMDEIDRIFNSHRKNTKQLDFANFNNALKEILKNNTENIEEFRKKILRFKSQEHIMRHARNDDTREDAKYQFKIIPHSGKTVQEIRDELQHRRNIKESSRVDYQMRKAKEELRYLKKMGLNKKAEEFVSDISKKGINSKKLEYLLPAAKEPEKLTIQNLDKFKDRFFDPRKFIEEDALEEYKPQGRRRMSRRSSETTVRELDISEKSREYVLQHKIDRRRQESLQKGLRVLDKLRK